ncbi:hypothetical protein AVEN_18744-1 [Araneus ventricosus]|uniref:Uncharacterized protein n=1 Tax=Araneus ventricosus TaxID=182803 RepID=A0A4Y2GPE1_ARAVE|nr:hypothetical protein AVEN_18744-1 [Araneus ventricosus]
MSGGMARTKTIALFDPTRVKHQLGCSRSTSALDAIFNSPAKQITWPDTSLGAELFCLARFLALKASESGQMDFRKPARGPVRERCLKFRSIFKTL